jgi:hypothetical protein
MIVTSIGDVAYRLTRRKLKLFLPLQQGISNLKNFGRKKTRRLVGFLSLENLIIQKS